MDAISKLLIKRVEKIYPSKKALEKALRNNKKLRVYLGVDPTGNKLHLGHSIALSKLQEFADLGHEVILLFGTGTVLVGDPSQRDKAREKITDKQIQQNISTWKNQVKNFINFRKVKIKKNADWLLKLDLKDIINITSKISAVQLFKRDMFKRRLKRGDTVWYHETLYPLLQGYDSVAMNIDLEIGGRDQTFNMLIGRELVKKMRHKEKFVLTIPMILGIDGKQMSKTSGNCVWLADTPNDMFGKIMSIPDTLVSSYFNLLTDTKSKTLRREKVEPIELKKKLAFEIVKKFHNKKQAEEAQKYFEKVVQKKGLPKEIAEVKVEWIDNEMINIVEILTQTKLTKSRSEAKRLVKQGAVCINGRQIPNIKHQILIKNGIIIKAGKRKYIKLRVNN